jgi:ribosomal protein S18 acetylase RimI-like enzyme
MNVSFGIEFEFDVIHKSGRVTSQVFYEGRTFIPSWDYQDDHTAGVELRTPVLTSLDQAISEISQQFNYWVERLDGYAPYPVNRGSRSLGQHMHIGRPTRRLRGWEKANLARAAANIYPFLAALHAQPLPSRRGLTSSYTAPIWEFGWRIPNEDHFCEISDSHNGTVEFRLFDANIPQVSLVNAWFLTELARKTFSENFPAIDVDRENYRKDRNLALRFGLGALDIRRYLEYFRNIVGDIRIPNYPFLREILYMAVKHRLNPFNVFLLSRVDHYQYFKQMFTNPDKFIENLGEPRNSTLMRIIRDTAENSGDLERLSDVIELASEPPKIAVRHDSPPYHSQNLPLRSYVAKRIELGEYEIRRISEVHNMDIHAVAERIEYLMTYHGDNFVNPVRAEDIINSPVRYYVFTVFNRVNNREDVLGAIGIDMRTGEVTSLVVDRRFRRLGIASRLIDHVRSVYGRPISGSVEKRNEPALNLLRRLGFRLIPLNSRTYRFTGGD